VCASACVCVCGCGRMDGIWGGISKYVWVLHRVLVYNTSRHACPRGVPVSSYSARRLAKGRNRSMYQPTMLYGALD